MQMLAMLTAHIALVALATIAVQAQLPGHYSGPVFESTTYDDGDIKITDTACAGAARLVGYTTFADIPAFVKIAGIQGKGAQDCGRCFEVEYKGTTAYGVLVDVSQKHGPSISSDAAKYLTGLPGEYPSGGVDMTITAVNQTACGMVARSLRIENMITSRQVKRKDILSRNLREGRYPRTAQLGRRIAIDRQAMYI